MFRFEEKWILFFEARLSILANPIRFSITDFISSYSLKPT